MDFVWINVLLCFVSIVQCIAAQANKNALFGKLVAIDNPNTKKSIQKQGRNQVFATRATAFMKKDGDLFKIHRPGLLGKKGTISFESVRLPGFFLRQKNKKVHLDNLKSRYITKDATFIESKDAVGETFRLFMHSDEFLCHEAGHGFSLFMIKDSPKRDTLNCAFNIVKVARKDNIGSSVLKQVKSKEPSKDIKAAVKVPSKAKPVSLYIKDKTTGQSIPEFKDLVDAIKQQKDPFPAQQGESLVAVIGPAKPVKPAPKKNAKQKAAQRKKLPTPGIDKKNSQAPKKNALQKGKKNTKQKNNGVTNVKAKQIQRKSPALGKTEKKGNTLVAPQPIHDMDASQFKMQNKYWFASNPTKKVYISNPYLQNIQRQQEYQQRYAQQQIAMKRYQFVNPQYPYNMQPQLPMQENPTGRQVIASLFPQPVSQFHETNVVGQPIQYVPPSQWKSVTNAYPSAWTHDAGHLINDLQKSSPTIVAAATDRLLTKLHPELDLLHSAHHDVNEVLSTDPNIHHLALQHRSQHLAPVQMTTLPHESALQSGQISEAVAEPVGLVQHIHLPSAFPIHDRDSSVRVSNTAPLVVALPQPSVITSNAIAATELVHKDPDITLEEAFHKMEPLSSHPIEVASESVHHVQAFHPGSLHPDKAFHMRTHYVTGKAVDMNEEDQNTLKEVHVVHHNHHLVHAANEDEKQKFVSSLVDSVKDLCVSLLFENGLGDRYRLVSTLNPHGYRPKSKRFSLKTIFKEPKKRKVMSFKAYDEEDSHRIVLLNGHQELNVYPVSCANDPVEVTVDSKMKKATLVTGSKKNEVLGQTRKAHSCTKVTGGTSSPGSCCTFPFIFKGHTYNNCLPFGDGKGRTWCSLTSDFDKERRWGMCSPPNLSVLHTEPAEEENNDTCPSTCTNGCGSNCPMWCCTDSSSSSLLH